MTARGKLTVRLPEESLAFLKRYAADHGLTVTEVVDRYLRRLRTQSSRTDVHEKVARMSGLVPREIDAAAEHVAHLLEKHR